MRTRFSPALRGAFTLIELLVLIVLVFILILMLLPVNPRGKPGPRTTALFDIAQIENAIERYYATYNTYPVSPAVKNAVASVGTTTGNYDMTYGGPLLGTILGAGIWTTNNSEVISILMDFESFPSGGITANNRHVENSQQIKFLSARMTTDRKSPGVDPDLVYRDPWGSPYIISIDLNNDAKCRDAFYSKSSVSFNYSAGAGHNGLFNSADSSGATDAYERNGGVMVWSLGPDKSASRGVKANVAPNKDNVLSWKAF